MNLIAESIVQTERLPTQQCNTKIIGLTGVSKKPLVRKVVGQLMSRFRDMPLAEIELVVMPQLVINSLPNTEQPIDLVPAEYRSELADPTFNVPAAVDMLLGAGLWALCLQDGSLVNHFDIVLQSSRLGWLVYGGGVRPELVGNICLAFQDDEERLDATLRRFWEIEEMSPVRMRTAEQEQCEDFFVQTHRKGTEGRYVVGIPLRSDVSEIGSSRQAPLRRYFALERRFERDLELREKYTSSMNELLSAGQMIEAKREPQGWCYHIPKRSFIFKRSFESCSTLPVRQIAEYH